MLLWVRTGTFPTCASVALAFVCLAVANDLLCSSQMLLCLDVLQTTLQCCTYISSYVSIHAHINQTLSPFSQSIVYQAYRHQMPYKLDHDLVGDSKLSETAVGEQECLSIWYGRNIVAEEWGMQQCLKRRVHAHDIYWEYRCYSWKYVVEDDKQMVRCREMDVVWRMGNMDGKELGWEHCEEMVMSGTLDVDLMNTAGRSVVTAVGVSG